MTDFDFASNVAVSSSSYPRRIFLRESPVAVQDIRHMGSMKEYSIVSILFLKESWIASLRTPRKDGRRLNPGLLRRASQRRRFGLDCFPKYSGQASRTPRNDTCLITIFLYIPLFRNLGSICLEAKPRMFLCLAKRMFRCS